MKFPHPCGAQLAEQVRNEIDPEKVVPDDYIVIREGSGDSSTPGISISGATGPTAEAAAVAIPHGKMRFTTAREIRAEGGKIVWAPELSRHGTLNQQHVDITLGKSSTFSELLPNPVARSDRIDGDKVER
jgi:hypothetical protein